MLSSNQIADLAAAIVATAETLGHTISANAAEMMADDLAGYEPDDIGNALRACRLELTSKLTLAAILQRIQSADGRPDPNEAWSMALAAADEAESVFLTTEIQLAMSASAPALAVGDKVAARMSFLSAYQRLVDKARREAKPVAWNLSMGHDPQRRVAAVEEASRLGRLPAPEARELISRLSHDPVTQDGQAIAGLITGRVAMPSERVREKLQAVKAEVLANKKSNEERRVREAEERRERFERVRNEQLAALEALQGRPA